MLTTVFYTQSKSLWWRTFVCYACQCKLHEVKQFHLPSKSIRRKSEFPVLRMRRKISCGQGRYSRASPFSTLNDAVVSDLHAPRRARPRHSTCTHCALAGNFMINSNQLKKLGEITPLHLPHQQENKILYSAHNRANSILHKNCGIVSPIRICN